MDAKQLLDSLEHGVVAIAPDWTISAWSGPAARITGLPAERVMGQSFWVAFPAARATHIERVLQEVLHDGKPQMYLAPAAATDFPGMVFETQVSRGPHNHLIMVFRQVREELGPESRAAHLMSALETERRLYLQLFNSLPTPALVLTVDGQILESNPEGVKLLGGADAVALRGRPMGDWTPAAHRSPLGAALRDAVTHRQELSLTVEYAGAPAGACGPCSFSRPGGRGGSRGWTGGGSPPACGLCGGGVSRRDGSGPACPSRRMFPPWRATRRSYSRCS